MALGFKKTIKLDFIAPEYADCHIIVRSGNWHDYREIADITKLLDSDDDIEATEQGTAKMVEFVKNHIIGGQVPNDNGEVVPLSRDEYDSLPIEAYSELYVQIVRGKRSPKGETNSGE